MNVTTAFSGRRGRGSRWLALAVIAGVLAACGGSSDDGDANAGGGSGGNGGEEGGQFTIAANAVTTNLDMATYDGLAHRHAYDPVKGPLVRYVNLDELPEGSLNSPSDVEPWLAESYEIVDDGIVFTLRDDVKSAYGNPLTPEAVVYSMERMFAVPDPIGTSLAKQAGIDEKAPATATGENTVKINAKVNPLSLFVFETYWFSPLDNVEMEKHATAADPWATEWLKTNTAMFGAYQVAEFAPGESITYEQNPNYTLEELAYPEVVVQAVPESAARISLVQTGQANMINNIAYDSLKVLKDDDRVTVVETTGGQQDVLQLNKKDPALADPRVRQAISQAIDREALLEGPYQGFGTPSTSLVSSVIPTENSTSPAFEHDVDAARQLLADAGHSDLKLTIAANQTEMSNVSADALLTALRQQLGEAGIQVEVETVPSNADFRAGYSGGKYATWIRTEGPLAADPVYLFNLYYVKGAASNFQGDDLPALNQAVQQAAPLFDAERQQAVAPGIQAANEAVLSVPLMETITGFVYADGTCPGPVNRSFQYHPQAAEPC
jgi:peptide/nickel transport system substrate-binding protein